MPGEALNSSRTVLGAVDEVLETAENYPGKFPKVDREHVLFDALSSQLSLAVCIEQFLLHITFPLLLPLFFRRYGRIFFYAQAFNSPISIINISVFYAMVLSAIMSTEKIGMQVVFPIGVYVIHRFMVALKYGTLSPSEYRKMMYGNSAGVKLHEAPNEKVKKVVAEYQSQLQLLSGWLRISDVLLEYELLTAAGRVGVDVHNYYFYLPNPENGKSEKVQFFRWQKLLSKAQDGQIRGMNSHPDGSYTVSVHHACVAILRKTEPTFIRQVVTTIWFFLSFCNACIPIIAVAYDNGLKELSAWAWVYYMTSFFINFGYSFAILSFVLTSFVDTYRRFKSAEYLDSLIRVADVDLNIKLRVGNGAGSQLHESELYTVNRLLERSSTFKFEEAVGDVEMKKSESECGPENADLKKNYNHSDVYAPKSLEFGQDIIDEFSEIIPKLDMKYASNYVAWAVCRTQLNDFGARIRFRLDVYNGEFLL